SISLPAGDYTLIFSYVGYESKQREIHLSKNESLNVPMAVESITGQEVVVTDQRKNENVSSIDMGRINLSMNKIRQLPAIFGEVDVLKAIQLLPGVLSSEGTAGLYIRGG